MRWSTFDPEAQQVLLDARRRAMAAGRRSITSAQLLAGCLGSASVIQVLDSVGIDPVEASTRLGERPLPDRSDLLAVLGIDVGAVAQALPAVESTPWLLRRWMTRPLRITLETPSSSIRFSASGRKVLEVGVWHAKRDHRLVSALDLLRGVLSDGRDPHHQCLMQDEHAARRLFASLFEPDRAGT